MTTGLLVACIVLLSIILVMLVGAFVLFSRQIAKTARSLDETLKSVRDNIVPLTDDIRQLATDADGLVAQTRVQVERIDRITGQIERILEGRAVTDAAGRVVTSSRATVASVLEAVKQGLRALRSARDESKEESTDE